jgi:Septum formation
VPFRTEQIELSGAMAYYLASEHWLDAVTPPLESHIARLLEVVQRILNVTTEEGDTEGQGGDLKGDVIASTVHAAAPRTPRRLLLIGAVGLAVAAVLAAVTFAIFSHTKSENGTPQHAQATTPQVIRQVSYRTLKSGECISAPKIRSGDVPLDVSVVPCSGKHDAEVLFAGDPWKRGQAYPGEKALEQQFTTYCDNLFKAYVGVSTQSSALSYTGILDASREVWSTGDRGMGCFVIDPKGELVGTVKGSHR